ncbi:MAG TPA: MaoC/PaaZ C-terminal domain-containing protein [Longimicrobiaceae bacterium]|nr:MaoC/PaaZ C-terminal domain-containing protein [Longimicrobiaceae bacterium]
MPSPLRAGLKLLWRGARERGSAATAVAVPRRKLAVEHPSLAAEPQRVRRYLRATAGEALSLERGGRLLLPPAYAAVWEASLALELLTLEGAPFPARGLLHLGSELVSIRPLHAGERVRCRVELARAEPARSGVRLELECRSWNAAGQLCQENRLMLLARTRHPAAHARRASARPTPAAVPEWVELARWTLGGGAGRRYARASGDYNPIHLWRWSARLAGFDRPILHGFCLEAMVAHALVEHRLGGDPTALRRLRIDFRTPLVLPASARLLVDDAGRSFRVEDAARPTKRPFAEGEWAG